MKAFVIHALVFSLLMVLGADQDTLRSRGMGRHLAEEETPISESQNDAEGFGAARRRAAKRPKSASEQAGTDRATVQVKYHGDRRRHLAASPFPKSHDQAFPIPLRI